MVDWFCIFDAAAGVCHKMHKIAFLPHSLFIKRSRERIETERKRERYIERERE